MKLYLITISKLMNLNFVFQISGYWGVVSLVVSPIQGKLPSDFHHGPRSLRRYLENYANGIHHHTNNTGGMGTVGQKL